jgi:uncharacterized protein (TIGR02271 family)
MTSSLFQDRIHEGMHVYSSDGEKLGKVRQLFATSFAIEKGFFFPKEYVVDYAEVSDVRGDEIVLSRTRSELLSESTTPRSGAAEATGATSTEAARIPLVEEALTAEKRVHEVGEVQIHKEVVVEEKQITVPVMHEVVRVETVPATGATTPTAAGAFREETVRIPVREEEVEISKHPVVREEVRVTKEVREVPETIDTTVRRERTSVETEGNVHQDIVPEEARAEEREEMPPKRTGTTG